MSKEPPMTLGQLGLIGAGAGGAYYAGNRLGERRAYDAIPKLTRKLERERSTLRALGGELAGQRGTGALKILGGLAAAGVGAKVIQNKLQERNERKMTESSGSVDDLYKMSGDEERYLKEIEKRAAALFLRIQHGEELSFEKEAHATNPREQALKTAAWVLCAEMIDHVKTAGPLEKRLAIGALGGLGLYGAATRLPVFGSGKPTVDKTPRRAATAAALGAAAGAGYHSGHRREAGSLVDEISETQKAIQKIRAKLPEAAKAREGGKAVSSSLGRILSRAL